MSEANRPLASAGVIFASMALVAWIDSFFLRIAEVAGLWQFHVLRALIVLPIMALYSRWSGVSIIPRKIWPVLARGFCVSVSMVLYFGSLAFLSVPQAAAGLFTSPLWVLLLTALVLRQRIGPRRIGAIILGFLGVLLVLNPGVGNLNIAYLMPLAGGFFYALGAIATRTWCAGETALALLAAFFVLMVFWGIGGISVLWLLGVEAPPGQAGLLLRAWGGLTPDATFWLFTQAICSVVGIYGLTRGYQLAEASYAAVFEYSFLVFAAFWALVLFGRAPGAMEVSGIFLILVSGLLIAASPAARRQTG